MSPDTTMSSSTSTTLNTTLPKLAPNGSNCLVWKTRMQGFLSLRKFANHLDDSTVPPIKPKPLADNPGEEDVKRFELANEKYEEWLFTDREVKHHIHLTIPDSLLIKLIKCKTSSELWKAICLEHEEKTKLFQMDMSRRLYNKRCGEADDIRAHFAKMSKLREELAATGRVFEEENFTSILTDSLPESYGNVISSVYASAKMNRKAVTTQDLIAVVEDEYS